MERILQEAGVEAYASCVVVFNAGTLGTLEVLGKQGSHGVGEWRSLMEVNFNAPAAFLSRLLEKGVYNNGAGYVAVCIVSMMQVCI